MKLGVVVEIFCSRPGCAKPLNQFNELDSNNLKTTSLGQLFCLTCDMPLILDGRYVIEKPLARGGFGITYLARDRRTPTLKRCVVKQLVLQGFDSDQTLLAKELFEREGAVLEDLGSHPQIPDLLAFFEIDVEGESFFYLVQEYIDGLTLESLIKDFGPLPESDVIEVLQKLLPVVAFVHDRKSIHRDIKPANIMVHRHTQVYYLLDFGAVKQIKSLTGPRSRRSTGIFTPGYGAPEQMNGDSVSPATDIYGLGATCIFLLTGKEPDSFVGTNWRDQAPRVSEALANVIDQMTAQSVEKRYRSASEVLNAIDRMRTQAVEKPSNEVLANVEGDTPGLEVSFKPSQAAEVEISTIKTDRGVKISRSLNQIPLQSFILSGFSIGFQLGMWGALAFTQGFRLLGVVPSLLLLLGIVLSLLFLRTQQILDNKDMVASTIASSVLVLILKAIFRGGFAVPRLVDLLAVSLVAGFGMVAILVMFRLFYQILHRFL